MFRWLKKHFIPHKGNDHRPYFLRSKNIRFLLVIIFIVEIGVLLLTFIPALNPINNYFTALVLPSVLDDLTNQNRQEQHLAVLTVNPILNKVAELKAQDMAEKGYFAHTSPEGKVPWYWFKQVGYDYEYAGENLAVDFTDSQDVVMAWMNSPTHRANIMKNAYTEVGTGVATGSYQGVSTIFVAQVYGRPAGEVAVKDVVNRPAKVAVKTLPTSSAKADSAIVLGAESNVVATRTPPRATSFIDTEPPRTYLKTNIFQKYATSPRHIADILLVIFGTLVALAICLKLFIRMDKRHPILITNGLVVLVIIFGVYVANNYVAKAKTEITTSFMGFQNEQ